MIFKIDYHELIKFGTKAPSAFKKSGSKFTSKRRKKTSENNQMHNMF